MTDVYDNDPTAMHADRLAAPAAASPISTLPPPELAPPATTPAAQPAPSPAADSFAAPAAQSLPAPAAQPVLTTQPPTTVQPTTVQPTTVQPTNVQPETTPAIVTGPSAVLAPDPAMAPIGMSMPSLPTNAPAPAPSPTSIPAGAPGYNPLDPAHDIANPAKKRRQPGSARRTVGRLMLVGVLGAGGFAAYEYGPGLYDEYVAKDEAAGEPDAPRTFPVPQVARPVVSAATVLLQDIAEVPGTTYQITTDFTTDVARIEVQRDDLPDLEVLTFGDAAFVRRLDGAQWYALERGSFPFDDELDRSDWVRTLDEFLPAAVRGRVSIDRSTDAEVASTSTRHLFLTVDSALLTALPVPLIEPGDVALETPASSEPTQTVETSEIPAATDAPADASTDAAATPDSLPAPATPPAATPAESSTESPATSAPIGPSTQIEVWVDDAGLIRKISGAPQLGAGTITVLSTAAEPYIPEFPDPLDVQPLTAAALIELAI